MAIQRSSALGLVFLCLASLLAAGCRPFDLAATRRTSPDGAYPLIAGTQVRNIILMIGDGMGTAQINAARLRAHGTEGQLAIDRMPVVGHVRTYAADALVTDSAAAATALATGVKTRNAAVAVTPEGKPLYTIMEAARDRGMATGLAVTSPITHATPAVFATHLANRIDEATIAEQLLASGVDVLLGGGRRFFLPRNLPGGGRSDQRNLIAEAASKGYRYVEKAVQMNAVTGSRVLGLFQSGPLSGEPSEPSLADMTAGAIAWLAPNRKGFFLMVEGSQIDWAGHTNDAGKMIEETLNFDEAVRVAVEFALEDRHTLVVVTGDHETGGLAINGGSPNGRSVETGWTTRQHTATDVPVFALGPNAIEFTGTMDNTRIPQNFARYLGIKDFPRVLP